MVALVKINATDKNIKSCMVILDIMLTTFTCSTGGFCLDWREDALEGSASIDDTSFPCASLLLDSGSISTSSAGLCGTLLMLLSVLPTWSVSFSASEEVLSACSLLLASASCKVFLASFVCGP